MRLGLRIGSGIGVVGAALLTGCWRGPQAAGPAPVPVVSVQPATATVTTGHGAAFSAQINGAPAADVTWSVLEPKGGMIDAGGNYRAPSGAGVFTVQAGFPFYPGQSATAKVTVVTPPAGEITAPPQVQAGAGDLMASVALVPGSTYAWSITGGRITDGADRFAVSFQAGTGPKVLLTCRVTNPAGDVLRSSLEIPVVPPVTLAVSPAAVTLTAGRAMKFGFTLEGGTSMAVVWSLGEPGAGSLDGAGHYVAPLVPGAYTVRVTAKDDPAKVAVARVKVVAKPPESLFAPDAFQPGLAGLRAQVLDVEGMTYAWEVDGGTITSGASGPVMLFQAGDGPSVTLRCRITNEAGDTFVATKVINEK